MNATASTVVGSETVSLGGCLFEKVGSPAAGLGEFVTAAAIAGAAEIAGVGPFLSKGATWAGALYDGHKSRGMPGLAEAAGQTGAGRIAGQMGGDAIVAAADGAGLTPWSDKAKERAAAKQGRGSRRRVALLRLVLPVTQAARALGHDPRGLRDEPA